MPAYLDQNALPPASVSETGQVADARGNVGFSAAVIPLLMALKRTAPLERQRLRLRSEKNDKTGLYGKPARYYDQNLALFSLGWCEKRFDFDKHGRLGVSWK
jgi:endoglucanase